jgi:TetR/AcrR family transcriptional regulator, fatty acid biosynthesis regulator
MAIVRKLTREEAKLVTRRRLLEATARLLTKTGYGGLSASAVAREAGVAQPTFYVHFRDKDELVRALAEEKIGEQRARLRDARASVHRMPGIEGVRETFRVGLRAIAENPGLFRLYAQERGQPGSPFGEQARRLEAELRHDLTEDLIGLGLPAATPAERTRVEMVAEAMVVQTEALGIAHLDGRYGDLEAIVDVLAAFAMGVLGHLVVAAGARTA